MRGGDSSLLSGFLIAWAVFSIGGGIGGLLLGVHWAIIIGTLLLGGVLLWAFWFIIRARHSPDLSATGDRKPLETHRRARTAALSLLVGWVSVAIGATALAVATSPPEWVWSLGIGILMVGVAHASIMLVWANRRG